MGVRESVWVYWCGCVREREHAGGGGGAHMPVQCMSLQRAKHSTTHTQALLYFGIRGAHQGLYITSFTHTFNIVSAPQLSYSEMLNRVEPLRREMSSLENEAEVTRVKGEEINKIIQALETSIGKYKEEYAVLISQVNTIKADLVTVEAKVCTPLGVHT